MNTTMFSDESAAQIGLDKVWRDYPHLTGRGVRCLQCEWNAGGGWSSPDADELLPVGVPRMDGYHATEVAKVIRRIAPGVRLMQMEEREFYKTLANPVGGSGWFRTETWKPRPAAWDIETHSWTGNRTLANDRLCNAQDERIVRDKIASFAACGNFPQDILPLWNRSLRVGIVGTPSTPSGDFPIGAGKTQPYPDFTVPTQWTSIASPVMAACLAIVLQAVREHGNAAPADAVDVAEDHLYATVVGRMPRIDLAVARIIGAPPPVLPPVPPPPPVETWETRIELIDTTFTPWAPATVTQERLKTELWRTYEISNLGNIRNDTTKPATAPETRVSSLP